MRHVRSTLWLPSLVVTATVLAAACGGGAGSRVVTPAAEPVSGQPQRPTQPTEVPVVDATPPPVPTGVLAGRVLAYATNAPVARARVILSADPTVLPHPRVALTDADGRFRFPDLPATPTYLLTVAKSGYAPRAYGEAPPSVPPSLITLAQDEVREDIVIQLTTEVTISGRVLDEDGTPFSGALVEAMRAIFEGDRRTLVTVAEAVTDDRGDFRLVGLPPGQYYLSASDPAFLDVGDKDGQLFYSPTFYPGVVFPDEAERITLDPGVSTERLEFRLRIIRPSRVLGSISTPPEDGGVAKPLLAAAVIMSPLRNDQFSLFTLTEPEMEPGGGFLFSNVPPGRYRIQARGETEREGVTWFQLFTLPVEGGDVRGVDIVVSRGAVVSGHVEWDSLTGDRPTSLSNIIVRMPMVDGNTFGDAVNGYVGSNDEWSVRGVMAGRHYFRIDGLPEGWHLKRVEYQGADITDQPWTFAYNEVVPDFKVVLTQRETVVRGFVVASERDDVQSYGVVAFPISPVYWRPQSRHIMLTYPDALGRYQFRGLPPGRYHIIATRGIDRSDLGRPEVFTLLSGTPAADHIVTLEEGRPQRFDPRPLTRTPGIGR